MATADELLATLSLESDSRVLTIDNDLRTISIPKSITALGVESDDDVHRLYFQIPRMYGNTDLSAFNIRINYMNARNEGDIYVVTDKKVLPSSITFSWLVGPNALAAKGSIKFIVCLKDSAADGTVLREFNTTVATLPVLEGLEVDASPLEGELQDILEQLTSLTDVKVSTINAVGSEQIAKVQQESTNQQANIVEKGKEVLATIPEDYQTTYNLANEGVRAKADAVIRTAEGNVIQVSDAASDPLRGLRLFGKTAQVTTNGKNLYNVADHRDGHFVATVDDDDWITMSADNTSGTSILYVNAYCNPQVEILPSTQYRVVVEVNSISKATLYVNDDGTSSPSQFVGNWVITTGSTHIKTLMTKDSFDDVLGCLRTFISVKAGESGSIKFRISILKDLSVNVRTFTYEPYTGIIPSPNPNYPQKLVNLGNDGRINMTVVGKNMIAPRTDTETKNGLTRSYNPEDGSMTITGSATAAVDTVIHLKDMNVHPFLNGGLPYTLKVYKDGVPINFGIKQVFTDGDITWGWKSVEKRDREVTQIYLQKTPAVGDTSFCGTYTIQLEYGKKATEYEPYRTTKNIIAVTPRGLSGCPIPKVFGSLVQGNYIDASGQRWICDEIDFERGVYIKRVYSHILDGTESISRSEWGSSGKYVFNIKPENMPAPSSFSFLGMCSHFNISNVANTTDLTIGIVSRTSTYVSCQYDAMTTVDEMSTWLAECNESGNPVTLMYVLETPVETALSVDEVKTYEELYTNNPHTTVYNDAGAWMEVGYNADAEIWLDSKLAERLPRDNYSAPAIVERASGEIIGVHDSSEDYVRGLKIFGKTIQNGSPAPNTPVALESVGDRWEEFNPNHISITVSGKNLLDVTLTSGTRSGLTITVHDDGRIDVKGTSTGGAIYLKNNLSLMPGTYTFSVGTKLSMSSGNGIWVYGGDANLFLTSGSKGSFVITKESLVNIYLFPVTGTTWDVTLYPQLELSPVATKYEKYKSETLAIPTPDGLPGIPVTSGGNYTDSSGQQWISDEIDFERGIYVRRIGRVTVDNSMTYFYNTDNHFLHTGSGLFYNVSAWETRILSTHFLPVGNGIDMYDYGWFQFNGNGGIRFRIEGLDSVEALNKWLDANTPEVIYPLVTPVETPLTHEQLSAYRSAALHTLYPNTTAINSANAWMELKYTADTELWVDKRIAERLPLKSTTITLYANKWVADGLKYSQVVSINGTTANSKIDLQPSPDQLADFVAGGVSLTTTNDNGVITVYAIGATPDGDCSMQVLITEVVQV